MDTDREADLGSDFAEYIATLLPLQQQAIATAQLAGCRFETRTERRYFGRDVRWLDTTTYEVFLPDGASAGTCEDIYECALVALSILNSHMRRPDAPKSDEIFRLDPENEQT